MSRNLNAILNPLESIQLSVTFYLLTYFVRKLNFALIRSTEMCSFFIADFEPIETEWANIAANCAETRTSRAEDMRTPSAFEHRCVRSIGRLWWYRFVSNSDVRCKLVSAMVKCLERGVD